MNGGLKTTDISHHRDTETQLKQQQHTTGFIETTVTSFATVVPIFHKTYLKIAAIPASLITYRKKMALPF